MSNVLLVGCGHMGSALMESWLNLKLYSFTIVDPFNSKKLLKKYKKNKVQVLDKPPSQNQIIKYDIIIFAVKPQIAKEVINYYKDFDYKKNSMIGSIIAGKKINFFKKNIKKSLELVRIMPNMPASIQKGVTCFVANSYMSKNNKKTINDLFSRVGKTIWLKNETQIDIITSISGSGPGFFFTFIHAFELAAQKIGIPKKLSRELVLSTFMGSGQLMEETKKEPLHLANSIAVRGGTTEAGIKILKKNNLNKIIYQTLLASYKKASTLGKKNQ